MKRLLQSTIASVGLFIMIGCGDTGCCGTSSILNEEQAVSKKQITPPSNTANIGESGVATSTPGNASNGLLPPTAIITINGNDDELVKVTPCTATTISAEKSTDPDGNDDALTYQWHTASTDKTYQKEFCEKGLYELTLKVTDEQNLTATDKTCLLVGLDTLPLRVDAGKDINAKVGESVALSARVLCQDDTGMTYQWSHCGEDLGSGKDITIDNYGVGTHMFKVVVTDAQGNCHSDYINVTITQ